MLKSPTRETPFAEHDSITTPVCRTLGGSSRVVATPSIFGFNDRPQAIKVIFRIQAQNRSNMRSCIVYLSFFLDVALFQALNTSYSPLHVAIAVAILSLILELIRALIKKKFERDYSNNAILANLYNINLRTLQRIRFY